MSKLLSIPRRGDDHLFVGGGGERDTRLHAGDGPSHRVAARAAAALALLPRPTRVIWNAPVDLSPTCRMEIAWWLRNLCRINEQAIRPRLFPALKDSHVFADASDTGAGAVLLVDGQEAASSSVI